MDDEEEYIRLSHKGRELLRINRVGQLFLSDDFDWDRATKKEWMIVLTTLSQALSRATHRAIDIEDAMQAVKEQNNRLLGIANGPEDHILEDRWANIIDET